MINLHCDDCNIDITIDGKVPEGANINCPICGVWLKEKGINKNKKDKEYQVNLEYSETYYYINSYHNRYISYR